MTALFGAFNTSSQYLFFPSNAECIAQAFERIGVRRAELEQPHLQNAIAELNLFLASFNNAGPNLAQVNFQTLNLVSGVASYALPYTIVTMLDAYVNQGAPPDLYMYQISRTEWSAIPDKTIQGTPNQYWFDRLQTPEIRIYPTPNASNWVFNYYSFRQIQDSVLQNSITPEVPNRALDAIVSGLSYRLSRIYRPEIEDKRKADAAEAWALYARQDTENVPTYISPALSQYYRI